MKHSAILGNIFRKFKHGIRKVFQVYSDGMHSQALEQVVKQHQLSGNSLGLIQTNERLRRKLLIQLCDFVEQFLESEIGITNQRDLEKDVLNFYESLKENPARKATKGATGDGLNLWLHLLVLQLQPSIIVESGVWVGRSLYTLRQASKLARIHAFDINFSKLIFNEPSIEYHEYDWSNSDITCQDTGFCYFDDHINNGRRIYEAYVKGFSHLVFDQCAAVGTVYPFRYPGLPSAIMIGENLLEEGDILEWTWRGQKLRYRFERHHTYGAEDLIEFVKPLPSLERWLGTIPGQAAYVKLNHPAPES